MGAGAAASGRLARPHIEALARRTGDTVHLGVLEDGEVFYLDKISGTRGLEMRSRVGLRMPMACTGLGKGLMLGLPRDQWHALYERAREFSAQSRIVRRWPPGRSSNGVWRAMSERDWSFDLEENEIGIRCVGAPVRDVRN